MLLFPSGGVLGLRRHANTFVGRDAITWLVSQGHAPSRAAAARLGNSMIAVWPSRLCVSVILSLCLCLSVSVILSSCLCLCLCQCCCCCVVSVAPDPPPRQPRCFSVPRLQEGLFRHVKDPAQPLKDKATSLYRFHVHSKSGDLPTSPGSVADSEVTSAAGSVTSTASASVLRRLFSKKPSQCPPFPLTLRRFSRACARFYPSSPPPPSLRIPPRPVGRGCQRRQPHRVGRTRQPRIQLEPPWARQRRPVVCVVTGRLPAQICVRLGCARPPGCGAAGK